MNIQVMSCWHTSYSAMPLHYATNGAHIMNCNREIESHDMKWDAVGRASAYRWLKYQGEYECYPSTNS